MKQCEHVNVIEFDAVTGDRIGKRRRRHWHPTMAADQGRLRGLALLRGEFPRDHTALALAAGDRHADVIEQQALHGMTAVGRDLPVRKARVMSGKLRRNGGFHSGFFH